jgi:hypothetical protein
MANGKLLRQLISTGLQGDEIGLDVMRHACTHFHA